MFSQCLLTSIDHFGTFGEGLKNELVLALALQDVLWV